MGVLDHLLHELGFRHRIVETSAKGVGDHFHNALTWGERL
jgi:hypothetical protein